LGGLLLQEHAKQEGLQGNTTSKTTTGNMSTNITKTFIDSLSQPHGDWDQRLHSDCMKERNTILLIPDSWEGKKKITQELISLALKPLAGIFPTLVGREGKS